MKNFNIESQKGFTLLEALVSLLVVALALFGILGLQMRTLTDTQFGVRQSQAIRLIEGLSERIRLNPNSIISSVADNYIIDWSSTTASGGTATSITCSSGCTAENLAKFDITQWQEAVKNTLPLGDAKVCYVNDETGTTSGARRQLGVMISWRESEKDLSSSSSTEKENYLKYFHLKSKDVDGNDVTCPSNKSCHMQFIQLTSRCLTNRSGGPTSIRLYCADGDIAKLSP